MHPLFITGLVLAGVTALAMPYYCKITFRGKSKKTLTVKMILSTLFLVTAILSLFSHEIRHNYMYILIAAFFMCFIGDYILGKSDTSGSFIEGSCCFAAGHVLNIVAFSLAGSRLFPRVGWFNGFEIGLFLAIACLMLLIIFAKKPDSDPMLVPMFIYCLIVALMVTKATGLAVRMLPQTHVMLMAPVGAACLLCSDYMLGMMRFKMHEKTVVFKSACTALYYVGQMLLALSMYTLIRF